MLKKASSYYRGPSSYYSPLWQHVGSFVLSKVVSTVYDGPSFTDSLYIKERLFQDGITETDVLNHVQGELRKPLVIQGPAGVGKTTFLNRTFHCEEGGECPWSICWVNVDNVRGGADKPQELIGIIEAQIGMRLQETIRNSGRLSEWWTFVLKQWNDPLGISSLLAEQVRQHGKVTQEVLIQLAELLRGMPFIELARLRFQFMRSVLNRIPVVVIDNSDLLHSGFYPELIKLAIDIASGAARPHQHSESGLRRASDHAAIVVALRPESYVGAGVRAPNVTIRGSLKPPRLDLVFKQRLTAMLNEINFHALPNPIVKDRKGRTIDLRFHDGSMIPLSEEDAKKLLMKVADALLTQSLAHEKLTHLLLELANYSVRVALVAIANFIASGHHEWKKILESIRANDNKPYKITSRKALKVLLLGSKSLYSTLESWPFNLFGDGQSDPDATLGYVRILRICEAEPKRAEARGISEESIVQYMEQLFSQNPNITRKQCKRIFSAGLINDDEERGIFRITIAGDRYLKIMSKDFEYLQHVVVDCYVDQKYLVPCTDADEQLSKRFERVLLFAQWVRELEITGLAEVVKRSKEKLYGEFYGGDTVTSSILGCLHDTYTSLPDLNGMPKGEEKLLKPLERLMRDSSIEALRQAVLSRQGAS